MKNTLVPSWLPAAVLLFLASVTLQFCDASKRLAGSEEPLVSFETDIYPLMERSCSPCHFPETGKKKLLNTYSAMKENVADILERIQLPEDADGYMPFKSKKEPFSADEVALVQKWVEQGMGK